MIWSNKRLVVVAIGLTNWMIPFHIPNLVRDSQVLSVSVWHFRFWDQFITLCFFFSSRKIFAAWVVRYVVYLKFLFLIFRPDLCYEMKINNSVCRLFHGDLPTLHQVQNCSPGHVGCSLINQPTFFCSKSGKNQTQKWYKRLLSMFLGHVEYFFLRAPDFSKSWK